MRRLPPALLGLMLLAGCQSLGTLPSGSLASLLSPGAPGASTGPVGTLTARPAGTLISNNAGTLISNNTSSLTTQVLAPASLIGNNAGNLVSNNAGTYRIQSLQEVPVTGAHVALFDTLSGSASQSATTDGQGGVSFAGLDASKSILVRVTFTLNGTTYHELALTRTASGSSTLQVNSASTMVGAKFVNHADKTAFDQLDAAQLLSTVDSVTSNESTISASVLTSESNAEAELDQLTESNPALQTAFKHLGKWFPSTAIPTFSVNVSTISVSVPTISTPVPTFSIPVR